MRRRATLFVLALALVSTHSLPSTTTINNVTIDPFSLAQLRSCKPKCYSAYRCKSCSKCPQFADLAATNLGVTQQDIKTVLVDSSAYKSGDWQLRNGIPHCYKDSSGNWDYRGEQEWLYDKVIYKACTECDPEEANQESSGESQDSAEKQEPLCYKLMAGEKELLVKPASGFPDRHSRVVNKVCGVQSKPGDPIPTDGQWDYYGNSDPGRCPKDQACLDTCGGNVFCTPFSSCRGVGYVNAGCLFYAYGFPNRASSNTGYEATDTITMFFVVDTGGEVWFVINLDKPGNPDGGRVRLRFGGSGLGKAYIAMMDDPAPPVKTSADACVNSRRDCFAWNRSQQKGSVRWVWWDCCTDGMVFGPLPSADFTMNFDFFEYSGIKNFRFGTYDDKAKSMDFKNVDRSAARDIVIKGYTCVDYCKSYKNCGACGITEGCVWCSRSGGEEECVHEDLTSECAETSNDCCDECSEFSECSSCFEHKDDVGCAWCEASGKCISGTDTTPCENCNLNDYLFDGPCPIPPKPVGGCEAERVEFGLSSLSWPATVTCEEQQVRLECPPTHTGFMEKKCVCEGSFVNKKISDEIGFLNMYKWTDVGQSKCEPKICTEIDYSAPGRAAMTSEKANPVFGSPTTIHMPTTVVGEKVTVPCSIKDSSLDGEVCLECSLTTDLRETWDYSSIIGGCRKKTCPAITHWSNEAPVKFEETLAGTGPVTKLCPSTWMNRRFSGEVTLNCIDGDTDWSGGSGECIECDIQCVGGTLNYETCTCECRGAWSGTLCDECKLECVPDQGDLDAGSCTCSCRTGFGGPTCSNNLTPMSPAYLGFPMFYLVMMLYRRMGELANPTIFLICMLLLKIHKDLGLT